MGMKSVLAFASLLVLMGCESFSFLQTTEAKMGILSGSNSIESMMGLQKSKMSEDGFSALFEKEILFPVTREDSLALVVLEDEPLTYEIVSNFFEEKVKGSFAAGILLQSNDLVLAFMPNSPVFQIWRLSGDLTQFKLLLNQIGTSFPFIPELMTTELFKEAFSDFPSLKATLIGSTLIEDQHLEFLAQSKRSSFDKNQLKHALEKSLPGSDVEIEIISQNTLALNIYLKDKDSLQEEELRKISSRILNQIKEQKGAYLFQSYTVDFLTSPSRNVYSDKSKTVTAEAEESLLMASLDLSVHELYAVSYDGQLNQTLAEPLDYFRYYGTVEYE